MKPLAMTSPVDMSGRQVVIALSGGVDSAVAAWLLCEQGCKVEAIFMKNWEEDDQEGYCSAAEDLADAQRICDRLDIGLRTVNFASEYWDKVFSRFLGEHELGRTPNPDVVCNQEIKFDVFLDFALSFGAARVATGHYARIEQRGDHTRLLKGLDESKDQSYFLHTLGQAELARVLFPLGGIAKREVRELATRVGLPVSDKKDSTGICFIGERPFKAFLSRFLPQRSGPIRTPDGCQIGCHDGLAFYTLGQRQGLGIGGRRNGSGEPWYVVEKNLEGNTLVVAQGRDHPKLYCSRVELSDCHWIRGSAPELPLSCRAKTRYRQPDQACTVLESPTGAWEVTFEAPQWAPTPGQSVVLYEGDECLGGGVIRRTKQ